MWERCMWGFEEALLLVVKQRVRNKSIEVALTVYMAATLKGIE